MRVSLLGRVTGNDNDSMWNKLGFSRQRCASQRLHAKGPEMSNLSLRLRRCRSTVPMMGSTTAAWTILWPKAASCWPSSTLRRMKKTRTTPKTCPCTRAGTRSFHLSFFVTYSTWVMLMFWVFFFKLITACYTKVKKSCAVIMFVPRKLFTRRKSKGNESWNKAWTLIFCSLHLCPIYWNHP